MCFFFNDTATTEIYTLSLHDALPICHRRQVDFTSFAPRGHYLGDARLEGYFRAMSWLAHVDIPLVHFDRFGRPHLRRSEEHTSELQSRQYLVCRLLLENTKSTITSHV